MTAETNGSTPPSVELRRAGEAETVLSIAGHLDAGTLPSIWDQAVGPVRARPPRTLTVQLGGVTYCDGAGIGMLVALDRLVRVAGGTATFEGLSDELRSILDMALLKDPTGALEPRILKVGFVEQIGTSTAAVLGDIGAIISFTGELTAALVWAALHPHRIRMRDMWLVAEKAGVNALPVVSLLGFLMGLIIAFQAAAPMAQFGAEALIPTIIAIAMVRELGPLMTAIILAGRSGSAFAAEIGTMKVTEELDALTTFGLDPTRFLVIPRVLASLIMTPLLAVFGTILGVFGGYLVMASLGYSLPYYVDQVLAAVTWVDFLQGEFKAVVFAMLVAGIGCLKGLRTGSGPSAVGDSTTGAVVAGIVLIVATDGILGVVFYFIGF